MSNEMKEFLSFAKKWLIAVAFIAGCALAIGYFSSCNIKKHITTNEKRIDSLAFVIHAANTQIMNNSGSKSEDNYESKSTTYYTKDTVKNTSYLDSVITVRKGTLIIKDTSIIHVNQTVYDTTRIQVIKEDKATEKQTKTSNSFGGIMIWAGIALAIIVLSYLIMKRFKIL